MIETKELTDSQHQGWDRFQDERGVIESREARFLASCLRELGGKDTEGWRFDYPNRVFYRHVPDPPKDNAASADTDA